MPLRSGLSVYVWGPSVSVSVGVPAIQDISNLMESLQFTNVAPGGFGTLSGLVRITRPHVPRPQFGLFSRIAVVSRGVTIWLGELIAPVYGYQAEAGDYVNLSALGIGNGLRDYPDTRSYSGQTPQQIAIALLNAHVTGTNKTLVAQLSTDTSQIFPDNPAATISQVYDQRTGEEVLSDIALLAGDYNWGIEADPVKKDLAQFPLGRLFVRARNLSNLDYSASITQRDVLSAEFTPTAARAYNQIQIDYQNATAGVARATATDARLASDKSQGTAPFRFRRYQRDLSGLTTVNSTVATSIANTYLNLYKNPTYMGRATLRALRNSAGSPMPLWEAQAGKNLFVPELAIAGAQLPTTPTQNANLFWITEASYRESASGESQLDVTLGYAPERAEVRIARLTMVGEQFARSGKVTNIVQASGAGLQGYWGFQVSNALAGGNVGVGVTYQTLATVVPTSITLSVITSANITGGSLTTTGSNALGFHVKGTVTAAGAANALGTYQTAGNCLRQVDAASGRFAHHCDGCDALHTDRAISDHLFVHPEERERPGLSGMSVTCPACGRIECYNTGLTSADEDDALAGPARAEQARLIRQLMVAAGLTRHP